jgi:hypothetical protein
VEPVKVTRRVTGSAMSVEEIAAGSPNTRFSTPGGKPASTKACASSTAPAGVSSAALRMIAQPAASAPPTLRAGELIGKFHGVKAATTPAGSRTTVWRMPGSAGMTRP